MSKIKLFENFDEAQNNANSSNSLITKVLVFGKNGTFLGSLDESSTEEYLSELQAKINESEEGITVYKVSESGSEELEEGLLDFLGLTFKSKVKKAEKTIETLSRTLAKNPNGKKIVDFKVAEYNDYKKKFEDIMKELGGDDKKANAEQKKIINIYKEIIYQLVNNGDFVYSVDAEKGKVKQTAGYGRMANVAP